MLNSLELLQLQDVSEGAKDAEDPKVEAKGEEDSFIYSFNKNK